jgi:putative FmdB family regulatory protein
VPIYEYRCNECEHQLEMLQKISDAPAITCPDCGKDSLRKLISAAAFKLKGTGWYETDFKDKKPKAETESSNSNNTDNKKSTGSDSKKSDNSNKGDTNTSKASAKPAASSSRPE